MINNVTINVIVLFPFSFIPRIFFISGTVQQNFKSGLLINLFRVWSTENLTPHVWSRRHPK